MRRRAVAVPLALSVLALAGCVSVPKAAQVELQIQDDGIVLVRPTGGELVQSGETVITILNYSSAEREFVLAETDASPESLPTALVEAISARDDDRIVAMTPPMDEVGDTTLLGIPQQLATVTSVHVHLAAGERYLLFDRLGGYDDGIAIELIPPN